jgi:hypothetical protein
VPQPTSSVDDLLGVAPVAAATEPVIPDDPVPEPVPDAVPDASDLAAPAALVTFSEEIDTSTAALLMPDEASTLDLSAPDAPLPPEPEPEPSPALDELPDDSLPA